MVDYHPLDLVEASRLGDVSPETVRRWCHRCGIGELKPEGWRIDPAKLRRVIEARTVLKHGVAV